MELINDINNTLSNVIDYGVNICNDLSARPSSNFIIIFDVKDMLA